MKVVFNGVITPGTKTVELPGKGAFNFVDGIADFPDEVAKMLLKEKMCKPWVDPKILVQVPEHAPVGKKEEEGK